MLGIAETKEEAVYKGLLGAGWKMIHPGTNKERPEAVLFSVRNSDLPELPALAKKYSDLGFKL